MVNFWTNFGKFIIDFGKFFVGMQEKHRSWKYMRRSTADFLQHLYHIFYLFILFLSFYLKKKKNLVDYG